MNDLLEYCRTSRQAEIMTVIAKHEALKDAAKELGIDVRNVQKCLKSVKEHAASKGYAPECGMTSPVQEGFRVIGTSTLTKTDDGDNIWIKTKANAAQQEILFEEYLDGIKSEVKPTQPVVWTPKDHTNKLLNAYTITDYHLGSISWHEETGTDWDTELAEDTLVAWFARAIDMSPDADKAVFAQLGDFMHFDGLTAVTPGHGHVLDTDSSFQQIVRIAIRAVRRILRMLLEKHNKVHVIMAEGNHDLAASAWLRELLFALYEEEPRITIDRTANPYYAYEHGQTALFYHHGHRKKMANISSVFAGQYRELFGRTKHAYAHLGHLHHDHLIEDNLMTVEQHRTIAAPDAYAAKGGWLSGRGAKVITYHENHGEVGRITVSPDMLD